tara:strand:+ start:319 stop:648 length:330 start_codon:yes stop_codon:yes gene_type:complete
MLIREILTESYDDDLIAVVRDLIVMAMNQDLSSIKMDNFQQALSDQGYDLDPEQIIQAVDKSGYASSVDDQEIVPKDQLSKDVSTDDEPSVDVSKMAGDQALSDIKAEL